MVYELKKKTIADLLSYNQDISYIIKNFKQKIRELRELVDTRIKRKRN